MARPAVAPCRSIRLGRGSGNYAVWLAQQGFDVTGIGLSAAAVARAQQLARSKAAACRFIVSDLLKPTDALDASCDFAHDWLVPHHVFPDDRPRYVANVLPLRRPGALCLSACFSKEDQAITGEGKYRQPQLGTLRCSSSEQEIRDRFEPSFDIEELTAVETEGKRARTGR